jgi:aminoglycoside phosphotransferase (APT) family kinase protein
VADSPHRKAAKPRTTLGGVEPLIPGWYLFGGDTRELFRAAADVDDTTWARGRGWALCLGLGAEHYYRIKNPPLATVGRRAMFEALADYRSTG